jgi:tetratricopeptide (TPR) repeat protein
MRLFVYLIPLLLLFLGIPLFGQEGRSGRKPVLIRPEPTADKVEEVEEGPPEPDPQKAKEHVEVGDFYYKRKNYSAAEERYREAIQFNPKWAKAYEKLVGLLEKQHAFGKLVGLLEKQHAFGEAVKVCEQFVQSSDSSKDVKRFQEWSIKLKAKAAETG